MNFLCRHWHGIFTVVGIIGLYAWTYMWVKVFIWHREEARLLERLWRKNRHLDP